MRNSKTLKSTTKRTSSGVVSAVGRDFDYRKVERLRDAIERGTFRIDVDTIAGRILDDIRDGSYEAPAEPLSPRLSIKQEACQAKNCEESA